MRRRVRGEGPPGRRPDGEYLVELSGSSGYYEFGPAEVRTPDATEWATVPGTTAEVLVVGSES